MPPVLLLRRHIVVQYILPLKLPVYIYHHKFCYQQIKTIHCCVKLVDIVILVGKSILFDCLILERKINKGTHNARIFNGAAEGAIQLNLKREERRANKFEQCHKLIV